MTRLHGRRLRAILLAALVVVVADAAVPCSAQAPAAEDPWPSLVNDVFKGRPIDDGTGLIGIEMPARAEDAAIVPVTVRSTLPSSDGRDLRNVTIVIDQNPAPVAGTFTLGTNAGVTSISTRVRVDSYTNVHAVAELSDGKLYAVKTFIKASGGCSAPAAKNADEARAHIGELKLRSFAATDASPGVREAQVMVRHPNNSGMQMDQVTRLYVPAFFVRDLKVWQGDDLVLALDGGISISENPSIRFTYRPNGAKTMRVEATDTDDHVSKGEWPVGGSEM
jgi:sulfur-oxidizing protein SoxY